MNATLLPPSYPLARACDAIGAGEEICERPGGRSSADLRRTAAGLVCWNPDAMERRDCAAVSDGMSATVTKLPVRAVLAASHELYCVSVALAFFRSRSPGRSTGSQIGRLRV